MFFTFSISRSKLDRWEYFSSSWTQAGSIPSELTLRLSEQPSDSSPKHYFLTSFCLNSKGPVHSPHICRPLWRAAHAHIYVCFQVFSEAYSIVPWQARHLYPSQRPGERDYQISSQDPGNLHSRDLRKALLFHR